MLKKLFSFLGFSLVSLFFSQETCPFVPNPITIEQGDTFTIDCSTPLLDNNCMTLNVDYTDVRNTTQYTVNSTTYAPVIGFDAGTLVNITSDDKWSNVIDLPFTFCFFGNSYNQLVIGDNGIVSFNTFLANQTCTYFSASIPNTALYSNSIFGVYHDLNNDDNVFGCNDNPNTPENECGDIRISTLGVAPCRIFVINYNNINHFNCENSRSTTQIVLYEGSNIIDVFVLDKPINCEETTSNSQARKNALIGIQNANGTISYSPSGRNSGVWSAHNEAYRFTPNGNSIALITWYDANNALIGHGNSVNVCPTQDTHYTAKIIYTQCDGSTQEFSDNIAIQFAPDFPKVITQEMIVCDTSPLGTENIDLNNYTNNLIGTQTGLNVTFHNSLQDAHNDINSINPTTISLTAAGAIYYVRAERPTCYNVGKLSLSLRETPTPQINELNVCDIQNDNTENINLLQFTSAIIGTQTQVNVSYYTNSTDATDGTNSITSLNIISASTVVYVRLAYENTNCINIVPIPILLRNTPEVNNITINYCTSISLNLDDYLDEITDISTNISHTYYNTIEDAIHEINAINGNSYNATAGQNVYVRIENSFNCYTIATISFTIFDFPEILNTYAVKCDTNEDGEELFDLNMYISDMINPLGTLSYTFYNSSIGAENEDVTDQITNSNAFAVVSNTEQLVYVNFKDTNTGCKLVRTLRLVSEEIPVITKDSIYVCDELPYGEEFLTFSHYLNQLIDVQNEFTNVHFYATENDALALTNEITVHNLMVSPTIFWVRTTVEDIDNVGNITVLCMGNPVPITFILDEILINNISIEICDNNNNGREIVNLTQYESQFPVISDRYDYVYNGVLISNPTSYEITTNPQVIDVAGYMVESQCPDITHITFTFKPVVTFSNIEMVQCDNDGDGIVNFNLTSNLSDINTNYTEYQISYYENMNDANAGNSNQITTITNYILNTNSHIIYIRLFDQNTGCYSVATITLTKINLPIIITTNASICDFNNDSIESNYLLSLMDNQLTGSQTGITVTYYNTLHDAQDDTNPITHYNITPTSVLYVRMESIADCVAVFSLQFTFLISPIGTHATTLICDNNNNSSEIIDLTSYNNLFIANPENYTITYFTHYNDAVNNANTITDYNNYEITSNGEIIYIRISNSNNCFDVVSLTVNYDEVVVVNNTIQRKCDNDNNLQETFDITQNLNLIVSNPNNYQIRFFTTYESSENEDTTYEITNPANTVVNGNLLIVYTRVEDPNSGCYSIAEIELYVNPTPKIIDVEIAVCDNNFDELYDLTLSDLNELIIEDTTHLSFRYFLSLPDAENETNELLANYAIHTIPTNIYVLAISTYGCKSIARVSLSSKPLVNINSITNELTLCDDDYDGIQTFDLTSFNNLITNEPNATIQFYPTFEDLQNGTNEIINPTAFENYIPTQTVYVKVSADDKCSQYTSFVIRVLEKPYDYLDDNYLLCSNGNISLSAETGMQYDIYLWNTGAQTPSITVTEAGTYTVQVTNTINGCSANFSTEVTLVPAPEMSYTFTSENEVTITLSNSENYSYSLDQINWQISPEFTLNTSGINTIYVRNNASGCIFSLSILMLEFTNIITPNGDGINDVWSVSNLQTLGSLALLEIYDRYGKVIYTQTSDTEFIWNGIYVGRNVHQNSYWYSIILKDGRKYQGYIVVKNY